MLIPRNVVPALELPLVGGGTWSLSERTPQNFTMIVFYRGLHCPICAKYLRELDDLLEQFDNVGTDVIAVSSDTRERAQEAKSKWKLDNLGMAYGLSRSDARAWGLFMSSGRGSEPEWFSEPGLFLIRPDRTLYASSVQTMPFARPHFADVAKALQFIVEKDYPARGELAA